VKATRFILIICLPVLAIAFFMLTIRPFRQEDKDVMMSAPAEPRTTGDYTHAVDPAIGQDGGIFEAENNERAANVAAERNDITTETLNGSPDSTAFSEPAYSVSPAYNDAVMSEDLPRANIEPGLSNRRDGRTAPADVADDAESDQIEIDAEGPYADTAEIYGQDGELLPFPEEVRARKVQDILRYCSDKKTEAVIVAAEGDDDYETEPGVHNLNDDTGLDEVDMEMFTKDVADVESVIEMLAYQNLHDDAIDPQLQIDWLWAALAEDNPTEVRLQAIYLLADVDYELIEEFLDDPEDLIRYEAERLVGILPED
jgi:hypothetical protein